MHHDASDITLNVCIQQSIQQDAQQDIEQPEEDEADEQEQPGASATGKAPVEARSPLTAPPSEAGHQSREGRRLPPSALSFCGVVGSRGHRRHSVTLRHRVGRAVVHLGARSVPCCHARIG